MGAGSGGKQDRVVAAASRPVASLVALLVTGVGLACGGPGAESPRDERSAAAVKASDEASLPWYRRGRALDLTGDASADSVHLEAIGERPDSLRITLTLLVGGEEKHREEWGSSYELALVDSASRRRARVDTVLGGKLDSVLASVAVRPLEAPGARLMREDSAVLAGLEPRPAQLVSFSYGYESRVRLVWDAPRRRFVRLWSCC